MNKRICIAARALSLATAALLISAHAQAATVATPVISPGGCACFSASVKITDATAGATIYYTTNNANPTTSSTKYTAPIEVLHTETIKAIAAKTGDTQSAIAAAAFEIKVQTPVFTPAAGTYVTSTSVKITDATAGATIYYTVNGTTPTTKSTKYTAPIKVSDTETIKAIAVDSGDFESAEASAAYTLETATAVFSPAAGKYVTSALVSITDTTPGASIYYTINGTTPTTKSTKYTAPIKVLDSETIKAIALAAGHTESAVASATYTLDVATPLFSPPAGTYSTAQSVKITDVTPGATIYYTINGTTPTTASTKYTAAIAVSAAKTIKALAVAAGHTQSAVASASYTIGTPTAAPVFSPAGGTYSSAQSVKISDATAAAIIYYTTNGAPPTTASTKYTAAIAVSASETIKAIALAAGHLESTVASATYTISSGSGGGSTAFYIPGVATPTSSAGKSGLFVVPAGAPTTAPTFITTTAVKVLNISFQFASVTSGSLGQYNPYAVIYLGVGGDAKYHVYRLPLTGTTVPKPVQISNLSLNAIADLCNDTEAETNITQPTTGFGLVEIPSSGTCSSGSSHVFELVRYTDSPSTAPTVVNVTTTSFSPIYVTSGPTPGTLAGMVMLDSAAKELLFYTSDAFTSPKTLVTGVTEYTAANVNYAGRFSGIDADFFAVTKTGGKQYLYRIDSSGDAISEYTAAGSLEFGIDVIDKSNLYFIDDVSSTSISGTATFLQEPLSGGAVTNLYALVYTPLETGNTLIGSNGSLLVYATNNILTSTGHLYTVPVGTHSTTATDLGSTFAGNVTGHLYGPTPGVGEFNSVLFVNAAKYGASTVAYASESLLPNGTVMQPLKANSQFMLETVISETSYGDLFQLQGITDTNGGSGGAKLYGVSIASGTATPYTTTGGGDYVVPAGNSMFVVPISSVIGAGDTVVIATSHTNGLVYNSTTHVIVTVSLPDTDVVLY